MILHKIERIRMIAVEFNYNFNFIPNYILLDFVIRSKNHINYYPYRINFVDNKIINSLME